MFSVLALGEFIEEEGIETSLGAFSELYHAVTSKHQKQMEMQMIIKGLKTDDIKQQLKNYKIEDKVELINWDNQQQVELSYENAAVMLLPTKDNLTKIISESFSFGLPVICFENFYNKEIIDPTCGMMVTADSVGENIIEFSNRLRILYFDPEAQKILKRGAKNKYKNAFSWGNEDPKASKELVNS